ncbi:MAG: hypothetical protein H7A35_07350 [Planctomycetales bacterium]|nr:hypothetical protein [bacterium]UNM09866.1 MAG: hypothetical protein H7A35_07350 [Planctomycetales bacterium]
MHFNDTQLLDRFWLSGGGLDTPFLYLRRARLVLSQLSLAYASGDSQQMESWRQVVEYSEQLLPDDERAEQFRSAWDSMHGLALLSQALAAMDEKQSNAAYGGLERVRDIMRQRSERRSRAGMEMLDDMELELAFLRTATVVKWRGEEADRDRLLSISQLRSALADDLLPRMRRHFSVRPPQEPYIDSAIMDLVNWGWILLLRLLLRFDQQAAAEELDAFNAQHADFLTLKPGFFRSGISEEGTSPFFWDLEIAKLWLLDELGRGDLEMLAEKRSRAFELHCMRHADNGWMRAFLLRETDLMRRHVTRSGQSG